MSFLDKGCYGCKQLVQVEGRMKTTWKIVVKNS